MTMFYNAFNRVEQGGGGGTVPVNYVKLDFCTTYSALAGKQIHVRNVSDLSHDVFVGTLSSTAVSGEYHVSGDVYCDAAGQYEVQVSGEKCYRPFVIETLDQSTLKVYVYPTLYGIYDNGWNSVAAGSNQHVCFYNTQYKNATNTPVNEQESINTKATGQGQYCNVLTAYMSVDTSASPQSINTNFVQGSGCAGIEDGVLGNNIGGVIYGILGNASPLGVAKFATARVSLTSPSIYTKRQEGYAKTYPQVMSSFGVYDINTSLSNYTLVLIGIDSDGRMHRLADASLIMYDWDTTEGIHLCSIDNYNGCHTISAVATFDAPHNNTAYASYAIGVASRNSSFPSVLVTNAYLSTFQVYVDSPYVVNLAPYGKYVSTDAYPTVPSGIYSSGGGYLNRLLASTPEGAMGTAVHSNNNYVCCLNVPFGCCDVIKAGVTLSAGADALSYFIDTFDKSLFGIMAQNPGNSSCVPNAIGPVGSTYRYGIDVNRALYYHHHSSAPDMWTEDYAFTNGERFEVGANVNIASRNGQYATVTDTPVNCYGIMYAPKDGSNTTIAFTNFELKGYKYLRIRNPFTQ